PRNFSAARRARSVHLAARSSLSVHTRESGYPELRTTPSSLGPRFRGDERGIDAVRSPFRRAELAPIDALLLHDGGGELHVARGRFALDPPEGRVPGVTPHRQALRHRRSLRQHAGEIAIAPLGREVDEVVAIAVGVDEAGQRTERQVVAIDRM